MDNKIGICCVCHLEFEKRAVNTKHCSDVCRNITKKNYADMYNKSYYVKNSEKIKAATKAYELNNIIKVREFQKRYREEHKEERSKWQFNYRKNNPVLLEKKRKYYAENKDRIKQMNIDNQKKKWNQIKESDRYFRNIFRHRYRIEAKEIPKELLEAYKSYVQLKREVRNVKSNSK